MLMFLRRLIVGLVAAACVALAFGSACKSEAKQPQGSDASEPTTDKAKARFKLTVQAPTIKSGVKGVASIVFEVIGGYKWNKQYPARVIIEGSPKIVSLTKKAFHQLTGDFESSEKKASVKVPMTARAVGEEAIDAQAKFSVCDDATCLIEKASVKIVVKVTP